MLEQVTMFSAILVILMGYIRKTPDTKVYRSFKRLLENTMKNENYIITSEDYIEGKSGPRGKIVVYKIGFVDHLKNEYESPKDVVYRKNLNICVKSITQTKMSWDALYNDLMSDAIHMKKKLKEKGANVEIEIGVPEQMQIDY